MKAKGYGNNVQMEVVNDGAESALFRSCFASWKDAFAVSGSKQAPKQSNIAKVSLQNFTKFHKICIIRICRLKKQNSMSPLFMKSLTLLLKNEWLTMDQAKLTYSESKIIRRVFKNF